MVEDGAMKFLSRSRKAGSLVTIVALVLASSLSLARQTSAVEAGQPAPDFKLPSTFGTDIALSDFRGKKWVLLEFYGVDFSPA